MQHKRYPPCVTSRLRRLDDAFERRIERVLPWSWVRRKSLGAGLIGGGAAYIAGSTVLLVVSLLTDRDLLLPIVFLVLGLVALPTGILLNRRQSRE